MGGEIQDTSKKSVLKAIEQADLLQEVRMGGGGGGWWCLPLSLYVWDTLHVSQVIKILDYDWLDRVRSHVILHCSAIKKMTKMAVFVHYLVTIQLQEIFHCGGSDHSQSPYLEWQLTNVLRIATTTKRRGSVKLQTTHSVLQWCSKSANRTAEILHI